MTKDALSYLIERRNDDWLIGYNHQDFWDLVEQTRLELQDWRSRFPKRISPNVILAERNQVCFLARLIAACLDNCHIFLANPNWTLGEWQQAFQLVQPEPDLIWGKVGGGEGERGRGGEGEDKEDRDDREDKEGKEEIGQFSTQNSKLKTQNFFTPTSPTSPSPPSFPHPLLMIPTGGSSGQIRFAMHTWESLLASVKGFQEYFAVDRVNCLCVLPLYHVSGLMQWLRSFTSGGKIWCLPFKSLETADLERIDPEEFFLSLVPTQLQTLLQIPELIPWLTRFQAVLLGGSPCWNELLQQARQYRIRLAPTYGMTETASQIVTLKPDDFLRCPGEGHPGVWARVGCGRVLPHAEVAICNDAGILLSENHVGRIRLRTQSLALGYYPDVFAEEWFQTEDLGFLDPQGFLHIVGRCNDKIITGGENVFPAEVEGAIRATGLVRDVCVVGVSDRHWGQAVTAVYVPDSPECAIAALKTALEKNLCNFKCPKHWIAVPHLPRNGQGKLNRQQVMTMIPTSYSNGE